MKKYINKIHYSSQLSSNDKLVKGFLKLISFAYLAGINIRDFLYTKNVLKKQKLDAFVVSVGNLTTGGTGKTPITVEIANYLSKRKKVAILSRGYGGLLSTRNTNIISDGKNVFYTPSLAGDEPYWMATNTENVMIITGKNRAYSGQVAVENYKVNALVLDDGFQHIKLERDLNLLVIDCCKKFGNNLILPAGPLREPMEEVKRADKIILSNKNPFDTVAKESCEKYAKYLTKEFNKPVYLSSFKTDGIYNLLTQEPLSEKSKVYAFAGIGQPEFFFLELVREGFEVAATREFSDHHLYTEEDLVNIIEEAKQVGAQSLVTTEKDAVKLKLILEDMKPDFDVFALKLSVDLDLEKLFEDVTV